MGNTIGRAKTPQNRPALRAPAANATRAAGPTSKFGKAAALIPRIARHRLGPTGNAAAADKFRLSNDVWRSVTAFLPRESVLSLRATNKEINAQVDPAITTMTLQGDDFDQFIDSSRFKHLKTLCLENFDIDQLHFLSAHLRKHPRPFLTVQLQGLYGTGKQCFLPFTKLALKKLIATGLDTWSTPGQLAACKFPVELSGRFTKESLHAAADLPTLHALTTNGKHLDADIARRLAEHPTLALLSITDAVPSVDTLRALASCIFPVKLGGRLSAEDLMAAADLPTLRKLVAHNAEMTMDVALHLSRHPALEALTLGVYDQTPIAILQLLGGMPTLRELTLIGDGSGVLEISSARAIASNASLERLRIAYVTIPEESDAILSQNATLAAHK